MFISIPLQPVIALLNSVISINDFRFHSADELTWYMASIGGYESSTAVNLGVWPVCQGESRAQCVRWISLQKLENKKKPTTTWNGLF